MAYTILVSGIVQGVGFRRFVLEKAIIHPISGWTGNLTNGKVFIIAEGTKQNLQSFVMDLRKGPLGSAVHKLRIMVVEVIGYEGFVIKPGSLDQKILDAV